MEFKFKNLNMRRGILICLASSILFAAILIFFFSLNILDLDTGKSDWLILVFAAMFLLIITLLSQTFLDQEIATINNQGLQSKLYGDIPFSEVKSYYFDNFSSTKLIIKTHTKKIVYTCGTLNSTASEFERFTACFQEKIIDYIKQAKEVASSGTTDSPAASAPKYESVYAKNWFLLLMIFASAIAGLFIFANYAKAIFVFGFLVPMWHLTLRARIAEKS